MNKATSSIFAPIGVCDNKEIYFQSQGGSKQMSSEVVPNNAKDSKSQEKAKQTKLIDSLREDKDLIDLSHIVSNSKKVLNRRTY
jgi:hypothetical protein